MIRKLLSFFIIVSCLTAGGFVSSQARAGQKLPPEKDGKRRVAGWLGVSVQDVNDRTVKKYKLKNDEGAFISSVVDDSPADSAGIREGDVIVEFGGKQVYDSDDLVKVVGRTPPGTKVSARLIRDGQQKNVDVTVGKLKERNSTFGGYLRTMPPEPFRGNMRMMLGGRDIGRILGMRLETLNEQLGEYFGAPGNEGVLVEEVEKGSTGDKAGFKAGDVITRVGKRSVDGVEGISKELRKHEEGDKLEVEVLRKGAKKVLAVEVGEDQSSEGWDLMPRDGPRVNIFRTPEGAAEQFEFEKDGPAPDMDELRMRIERMTKQLRSHEGVFERGPMEHFFESPREVHL